MHWLNSRIGLVGLALVLVQRECGAQIANHQAFQAFERHDFAQARRVLEASVATNSNDFEAQVYLGRIALEEGRLDDGIRWLEQAATGLRSNAVAFLWLGRAYGLQARAAGAPSGAGPARRSKGAFQKALNLDPNLIEARAGLVMFYREAPRIIGGGRKFALSEVEEIKKRDRYFGLLVHGDVLMDSRKYSEAAGLYREAAETSPDRVEAWYRLGILFLETKQFPKAFEVFDKILALNPNEQSVHFYIGKAAALSGEQLKRGEQSLKIYLQVKPWYIMPRLSDAHLHLGRIYEWQRRTNDARSEYEAALKLDPACGEARSSLRRIAP